MTDVNRLTRNCPARKASRLGDGAKGKDLMTDNIRPHAQINNPHHPSVQVTPALEVNPYTTIPVLLEQLSQAVETNFPGLWLYVKLALSTFATLFLKDNDDPVALILVGPPSSSKTTIARMFTSHPLAYISDKFSPASFVSAAANVSKENLKKVLSPLIRANSFAK